MKTNKKAILGVLMAMVMLLGVMGGINQNKKTAETNLFMAAVAISSDVKMSRGQQLYYAAYSGAISGMVGCAFGPAGGLVSFAMGF